MFWPKIQLSGRCGMANYIQGGFSQKRTQSRSGEIVSTVLNLSRLLKTQSWIQNGRLYGLSQGILASRRLWWVEAAWRVRKSIFRTQSFQKCGLLSLLFKIIFGVLFIARRSGFIDLSPREEIWFCIETFLDSGDQVIMPANAIWWLDLVFGTSCDSKKLYHRELSSLDLFTSSFICEAVTHFQVVLHLVDKFL